MGPECHPPAASAAAKQATPALSQPLRSARPGSCPGSCRGAQLPSASSTTCCSSCTCSRTSSQEGASCGGGGCCSSTAAAHPAAAAPVAVVAAAPCQCCAAQHQAAVLAPACEHRVPAPGSPVLAPLQSPSCKERLIRSHCKCIASVSSRNGCCEGRQVGRALRILQRVRTHVSPCRRPAAALSPSPARMKLS